MNHQNWGEFKGRQQPASGEGREGGLALLNGRIFGRWGCGSWREQFSPCSWDLSRGRGASWADVLGHGRARQAGHPGTQPGASLAVPEAEKWFRSPHYPQFMKAACQA